MAIAGDLELAFDSRTKHRVGQIRVKIPSLDKGGDVVDRLAHIGEPSEGIMPHRASAGIVRYPRAHMD